MLVEINVTRIEVSAQRIMFFNNDVCEYEVPIYQFPNFVKGECLDINLKAKMFVDRQSNVITPFKRYCANCGEELGNDVSGTLCSECK